MKKNKLSNILKIGILFFGISLLFWSCEKEADYIIQEPKGQKSLLVKQSSFEEMIQDLNFKSIFEKFDEEKKNYIRNQFSAKSSKSENNDLYNFQVIQKKVNIIQKDSITSYTFGVKRHITSIDFFENLVLKKTKKGQVESYLIRYIYDKNLKLETLEEGFSFKGTIKTVKIDFNKIKFQGKYEVDCVDNFLMLCSGGNNGNCNGTPHIPGGICFQSYDQCFGDTYVGRTCTGSFTSDGISYDTSDSHNSSGGGGTNNVNTTPVVYPCNDPVHGCDKIPHLKLANNLNITDQNQIDFLEDNPIMVDEMNTFLEDNTNSIEAENFAREIILTGKNGDLISAFPFVKYPPGSNYGTLYPKLTEYLKNKLPTLKNNLTIINKIVKYGDLSALEVKEHLEWGKGPTIEIKQLGGEKYGLFNGNSPNTLNLDIDLVNDLENTTPNTKLANAFSFLIGVTILHEYVHLSEYTDGSWNSPESGELFEIDAYGQSVWRNNASIILKRN